MHAFFFFFEITKFWKVVRSDPETEVMIKLINLYVLISLWVRAVITCKSYAEKIASENQYSLPSARSMNVMWLALNDVILCYNVCVRVLVWKRITFATFTSGIHATPESPSPKKQKLFFSETLQGPFLVWELQGWVLFRMEQKQIIFEPVTQTPMHAFWLALLSFPIMWPFFIRKQTVTREWSRNMVYFFRRVSLSGGSFWSEAKTLFWKEMGFFVFKRKHILMWTLAEGSD